ncbi:hypothetical protein KKG22_03500 [Patescibacteria group bacterium]|nr:hypothetical protein [Patescibacteria group bacterium]MBU1721215.1 hypothetical protein [Patescibacteria group bacterium]MBU1901077.1 hypothetical protein [Patescibacteria group bacterium]
MLLSLNHLITRTLEILKQEKKIFFIYTIILTAITFLSKIIFLLLANNTPSLLFLLIAAIAAVLSTSAVIMLIKQSDDLLNKTAKPIQTYTAYILPVLLPVLVITFLINIVRTFAFNVFLIQGIIFNTSLIQLGGAIIFIIAAIIFGIWFAFIRQAMILDKRSIIQSFVYSKSLSKGRWLPVFGRIALMLIIVLVAQNIFETIVNGIYSFFPYISSNILYTFLSLPKIFVQALTGVFIVIYFNILYRHLQKQP